MNQEIIDYIKKTGKNGWLSWLLRDDRFIIKELIDKNFSKEEIFDAYKYLIENEHYRIGDYNPHWRYVFPTEKGQIKKVRHLIFYEPPQVSKEVLKKRQNILMAILF